MTWSIIARDAASGAFGVAIATRFFAVGALCPYAQSGVGALSTQALMNPHYGPQGLELLRAGLRGARLNVEINLGGVKDQTYAAEVVAEVARLSESGAAGAPSASS